MTQLINYFEHQPDSHRIAILFITTFILWYLEAILTKENKYIKWRHTLLNTTFTLIDAPVQAIFGIILTVIIQWTSTHHFGLLYQLNIKSSLWSFIIIFVSLDFLEYVYHIFMHSYKSLWMFHLVHHSDRQLDVTTVFREHPGETTIRLSFLSLWMLLTGATFWMLLFRQAIQIVFNVWSHTKLRIPEYIDKYLSYILITPNVHQVHHHYQQPFTDSNYGDVLSIWDRVFGTFRQLEADKIIIGVDTHMDWSKNNKLVPLLKIPLEQADNSNHLELNNSQRNFSTRL